MRAEDYLLIALFALLGYALGSLSPSVYITRKYGGFDVREVGSGNAGSTNVLRTMGWRFALIVFGLDTLKGLVSTSLPLLLLPKEVAFYASAIAGCTCVLGHVFPIFLKFKGGKGVATSLGVLLILQPYLALGMLALFILIVWLTNIVSLGSLLAVIAGTIATIFIERVPELHTWVFIFCTLFIFFTHRANVQRLLTGKENRINFKKLKR